MHISVLRSIIFISPFLVWLSLTFSSAETSFCVIAYGLLQFGTSWFCRNVQKYSIFTHLACKIIQYLYTSTSSIIMFVGSWVNTLYPILERTQCSISFRMHFSVCKPPTLKKNSHMFSPINITTDWLAAWTRSIVFMLSKWPTCTVEFLALPVLDEMLFWWHFFSVPGLSFKGFRTK